MKYLENYELGIRTAVSEANAAILNSAFLIPDYKKTSVNRFSSTFLNRHYRGLPVWLAPIKVCPRFWKTE
ncbi:hypothetical protein SMSP2_02596 [Limihaloglobus sulfuriphilus]|uniref:Uncharacterized protein n=1 Tax=Limihaloglobus sulfuriphilus TaxID=1851148 RepID=A0A1Q2MHM8_9BACT|nr:hypothetical protein SMSP2_02596 [Limihaloglobus sulfuriphilus]